MLSLIEHRVNHRIGEIYFRRGHGGTKTTVRLFSDLFTGKENFYLPLKRQSGYNAKSGRIIKICLLLNNYISLFPRFYYSTE